MHRAKLCFLQYKKNKACNIIPLICTDKRSKVYQRRVSQRLYLDIGTGKTREKYISTRQDFHVS